MKTATIIAAIAASAFAAAPAIAQQESFEFEFTYDVQKLETMEGAQDILNELEAKVTSECTVTRHGSRIINRQVTEACIDATMDQAIKSINSRQLSAAYSNSVQG